MHKVLQEKEIWKPIIGYEDHYEISNLGRLMSLNYRGSKYKHILKTNINKNGYEHVRLNVNKVGVNKKIHRLVSEAFIKNPENKPCINHKDSNKCNNNVNNLEWCTHSENTIHAFKNMKIPIINGENNQSSKLKNKHVIEIFKSLESHRKLAKEYGVTKSAITSIKSKKTWKEVTKNI